MKLLLMIGAICLALITPMSQAVIEAYPFSDSALQQRYHTLIAELRCPKCQNQNLADSDAPIAADMRAEIYRQLHQGESDQGIEDFLIDRYGEFVLYRPRLNQHTLLLWLAPLILLLLVSVVVLVLIKRKPAPAVISAPQLQAELDKILHPDEDSR